MFTPHCRAGVHARRTYYKNLKNYRCGGVKTPPYRAAETVMLPINPAWGAPLPGGIYASPTNTRGRVNDTGDGGRRKVYGPHACGPQTLRGLGAAGWVWCVPYTVGRAFTPAEPIILKIIFIMCGRANGYISREPPRDGAPLPGGIYASPTNTRGRVHEPKTLPWGERPRRGLRPQARFGAQPGRKARLLAHRSRPRPAEQGKNVPCPAKTCIFMQERAPAAPRPVRIAKKPPKSPLPLCALPLAFWQKCCIIYNIE